MSAHSAAGSICFGCGRTFNFIDYHVPHCAPAKDQLAAFAAWKDSREKGKQNTSNAAVGR